MLRRRDFLTEPQLGKANRFEPRHKYTLLSRFALESMEIALTRDEDFESFEIANLIRVAEKLPRDFLEIAPDRIREIVVEIRDEAGLICGSKNENHGIYTFAHRSFHEYCAARELADLGDEGFQRLQQYLAQPAWRQTVLFYCGMDHRYAELVLERLLDSERNISRLELAGQCAAVLLRPQVELRLRVVTKLGEALSDTDKPAARRLLLLSLLELNRDAPFRVYAAITTVLQELIIRDDTKELFAELNRLDKETVLPLLMFMAESKKPDHQRAALQCAEEFNLEGQEKIPLLWQLLPKFENRKDTEFAALTRRQLLVGMTEGSAIARLNALPAYFEELDEAKLRTVYPFPTRTKGVANNNFVRLLVLEAAAIGRGLSLPTYLKNPTNSWEQFLAMVVNLKNPRQAKAWQTLPVDRKRWSWSIPWQRLGQIGIGLVMLGGLWATVLFFIHVHLNYDEKPLNWGIIILLSAFLNAGLLQILWPSWRSLAQYMGWLENYGIAPSNAHNMLEDEKNREKRVPG